MSDQISFTLRDGMDLAGLDLEELWLRYVSLGGTGDAASVALYVLGEASGDEQQYNVIAQALNEVFLERGHCTFPVGYRGLPAPRITPARLSAGSAPESRSLEARRNAAVARLRSAAAARRAAALHATAAQLMQASGHLQSAVHAERRAAAARARGFRSTAA